MGKIFVDINKKNSIKKNKMEKWEPKFYLKNTCKHVLLTDMKNPLTITDDQNIFIIIRRQLPLTN